MPCHGIGGTMGDTYEADCNHCRGADRRIVIVFGIGTKQRARWPATYSTAADGACACSGLVVGGIRLSGFNRSLRASR
jgi:hypothetical protein